MKFNAHFAVPAKEVAPDLRFDVCRSRFAGLFQGLMITTLSEKLAGSKKMMLWNEDVQIHELSQSEVAINRYRQDGAFEWNRLNPVSSKLANQSQQFLCEEKIAGSRRAKPAAQLHQVLRRDKVSGDGLQPRSQQVGNSMAPRSLQQVRPIMALRGQVANGPV